MISSQLGRGRRGIKGTRRHKTRVSVQVDSKQNVQSSSVHAAEECFNPFSGYGPTPQVVMMWVVSTSSMIMELSCRERAYKKDGQIIFFRVSQVPQQCTKTFEVFNAWTNESIQLETRWRERKRGSRSRMLRKDSKKRIWACMQREGSFLTFFTVLDSTACPYLKLACPTWTNQSSSRL